MKRHPYILATIIATLLAIVAWLCVPKEYTAITKLSDEYKETELAIGFNSIKAQLKELTGGANTGINEMAVYCKLLKTDDFARNLSKKHVPDKNMTYGQYICDKDTIETIKEHINYNYSSKHETLTISFTDRDPAVAAQMLDSVTILLQQIITQHRHTVADSARQNAKREVAAAKAKYQQAIDNYGQFVDSHVRINTYALRQQEKELENESKTAYAIYQKAVDEFVRQEALLQRSFLSFTTIQDNSVPQENNKHLIGYILSFITLALLFTHGFKRYKNMKQHQGLSLKQLSNYFSPWFLSIAIWTLILGLYYIIDTDLYPITEQFYYCFFLWLPIFCICSLGAYYLSSDAPIKTTPANGIDFNKSIFYFFFTISLIITPLYLYRIYQIVTMFDTTDLLNNVRILALYGEGQGFLNYSAIINEALFIVAIWAYPKVPLWQVILLGAACLMNSLAIMEKGLMFFVFISSIFVLFEKRVIRLRSIVIFGILLILLFYIFNLGRAEEDSDYQKEETLLGFFTMYVLSPPVAFCQLLPEVIPQFGTNTFEIIYLFMDRFGADVVVKDRLQEFVFVPVSTNVYTIFQPFFIDFGYRGIAFFATVYGCICGFLYRLFQNGNGIGTCLYTYFVYVLTLQFYQENVFLSMVSIVQLTFFFFLLTQKNIRLVLQPKQSL